MPDDPPKTIRQLIAEAKQKALDDLFNRIEKELENEDCIWRPPTEKKDE